MTFAIIMIFITLYLCSLTIWLQTRQIKRLNKKIKDLEYLQTELTGDFYELKKNLDEKMDEVIIDTQRQLYKSELTLIEKFYDEYYKLKRELLFHTHKKAKEETDVQQEEAE